ncbi:MULTISPECIES: secretin and TonB N-terminal domain-containing protein [unclassified Sinorhizobium]|uniref:STN domain-containing protein n=1 Tax=unclassified Sinorhizobium TaxID=2613772 RepID=UPI0035241D18
MDVKGKGQTHSVLVRFASAISATALLMGLSTLPDDASAQGTTSRVSSPAATVALDIPAQNLNGAILSFADKAGIQVFYDTARVQGLRSPGVQGSFTPQEALARILAGTGLAYRFTGPNTATIGTPSSETGLPADGATTLAPIVVQAQTAWGPVEGFVATRSATGSKTDTPIIEIPQSVSVVSTAKGSPASAAFQLIGGR